MGQTAESPPPSPKGVQAGWKKPLHSVIFYLAHFLVAYHGILRPFPFHQTAADDHTLWQSDTLDLNIDVLGQGLDSHTAASRLVGEPLGVLLVHSLISY